MSLLHAMLTSCTVTIILLIRSSRAQSGERVTVLQARCVAACLDEYATGSLSSGRHCNVTGICHQCYNFCVQPLTLSQFKSSTQCHQACGNELFCQAACGFYNSQDRPGARLTTAPLSSMNITSKSLTLHWTPAVGSVFLICETAQTSCQVNDTSRHLLVIDNSVLVTGVQAADRADDFQVAAISTAGSDGFGPRSVLQAGLVSDIHLSSPWYNHTAHLSHFNISWTPSSTDGVIGQRQFKVFFDHTQKHHFVGTDRCNYKYEILVNESHVEVPLHRNGLKLECTYNITVTALPFGFPHTIFQQVVGGAIDVRVTEPCSEFKIQKEFNFTVAALNDTLMVIRWGWWSFNSSLPIASLFASISYFFVNIHALPFEQRSATSPTITPDMLDANDSFSVTYSGNLSAFTEYRVLVHFHIFKQKVEVNDVEGPTQKSEFSICTSPTKRIKTAALLRRIWVTSPLPTSSPDGHGSSSSNKTVLIVTPLLVLLVITVNVAVACVVCSRRKKTVVETTDNSHGGTAETEVEGIALEVPDVIRPKPDQWEILRSSVRLDVQLGKGAFGRVMRGVLTQPGKDAQEEQVAVKMLFDTASDKDKTDLLEEIERMKEIGEHAHLVKFVGCCTQDDPIYLVTECVPHGSFKELLRLTRETHQRDGSLVALANEGKPVLSLLDNGYLHPSEICNFSRQIAAGMAHLSRLRMIHRDLATRNVLVDRNKVLKVADFGMTRDVYEDPDEVYIKTTKGKVPIRWMSPESLTLRTYSTESDVWSFGIVVWEITTFALFPYPGIANSELVAFLKKGKRLAQPESCPDEVYDILLRCWADVPDHRPKFPELVSVFEHLPLLIESQAKDNRSRPYSYPDANQINHQMADLRLSQPVGMRHLDTTGQTGVPFSSNMLDDIILV